MQDESETDKRKGKERKGRAKTYGIGIAGGIVGESEARRNGEGGVR